MSYSDNFGYALSARAGNANRWTATIIIFPSHKNTSHKNINPTSPQTPATIHPMKLMSMVEPPQSLLCHLPASCNAQTQGLRADKRQEVSDLRQPLT